MLIGTTMAWFTDSVTSGVNKIVAGNLDIEVEYNKLNADGTLSDTWLSLQDADSLFSNNLWEPGHTEYAVIRIKNAGSLALKYQVKVDVVSETGSINVEGAQFKLSDYLMYGVEYSTTVPALNRDGVVALATDALGAYSSETRNLEVGPNYDYMVLAITMPTTVGNEANYDKQYNAPSIDLGITVLATQKTTESDSFGDNYDTGAQYPLPTFTTTSNASFPVTNQAELGAGETEVEIPLTANTTTSAEPVKVGKVVVPSDRLANNADPVVVEVMPTEQGSFTVGTGKDAKFYDITVSNLNASTDTNGKVKVTLQLDPGLTDVVIKHNKNGNIEIIPCQYDGITGEVTFETASFSPFAVEYKCDKVAKIGNVYYSSLADAVAAAQNGNVVTLLKDVVAEQPLEIKHSITLDGQGYSLASAQGKERVINVNDNTEHIYLTLINLDVVGPTSGTYTRGISAYKNKGLTLTVDNCSVSANYYALNIAGANEKVEVIVKNSALDGWCAFQTWSAGTKATFENCTLIGTNDKSYNAEGWNDFATVIINENTTNVDLTFKNCRIEANQTTGNNQYLFSIRAAGAKVTMDGCTFFANGAEIAADELNNYISVYSPEALDFVMTIDGKIAVFVATEEKLRAVLSASGTGDYVYLANDIELSAVLLIEKSVVIKGEGHNIYNTANRVIRITKPNLEVEMYDLGVISQCTATSDVRGISFDNVSSGSSLLLDGCTVSAAFYAINIVAGPKNLNITIKNGTVAAGWAAINSYANDSIFNIENSVLSGLNDKGENSWNNFATIVFDGNGLWYESNIGKYGSNNTMNISNSTIYACSESSNKQAWLAVQYGAWNEKITVDANTKIIDMSNNDQSENVTFCPCVGYNDNDTIKHTYDVHTAITIGDETEMCCYFGDLSDEDKAEGFSHVPFDGCTTKVE